MAGPDRPGSALSIGSKSASQDADPRPLSFSVAKAGKYHLNEEITPVLTTGVGERYSQTISNLGRAALLRRCKLPL
jgi:hypothetical protein